MKKDTENQPIFLDRRHARPRKTLQKRVALVLGAVAVCLVAAVIRHYALAGQAQALILQKADFRSALPASSLLDLNTATQAELEGLPGIGPALAENILDWREENGPFRSKEDVLAVRGIGEATYEKILPYITY